MANTAIENFYGNGSWTAPAGVTRVTVYAYKNPAYYIGGGAANNVVLDVYGNQYSFGQNTSGTLGNGTTTGQSTPVAVLGGFQFSKVFLQGGGNCYLQAPTGKLYAMGSGGSGELGLGDVIPRSSPVAVLGGFFFDEVIFSPSGSSTILKTPSGKLYGMGSNGGGEIGVGDITPRSSPVAVLGGFAFTRIVCSSTTGFGMLTPDGTAYGMGTNQNGQLGVGDVAKRSSPVAVLGGLTFARIYGGNAFTLFVKSDGTTYGAGGNSNGQLGVGNVTARSSPVAVVGGIIFRPDLIFTPGSSGGSQWFGCDKQNKCYAIGFNGNGELGLGDVNPRSSPVAVLGGLKIQKVIFPTSGNVILLATDGSAYGIGLNSSGMLGVGDSTPRSSPVAVLGGLKFLDIVANGNGSCWLGLATDGRLYGCGNNTAGRLGVGDNTNRSSPVAVLGELAIQSFPTVATVDVDVVPGTSYTITLQQFEAFFADTMIGQGGFDSVKVIYQQ